MVRRAWALLAVVALLISLPGCFMDWSPDGRQLVVTWGKSDNEGALALIGADGSGFRFMPGSEKGISPSWSPDGASLLFAIADLNVTTTDGKPASDTVTKLYDVARQTTRNLPESLTPPYIWREDGKRFTALHNLEDGGFEMVWYNLPEGGVSLRVKLPGLGLMPINQQAVWLPATDDVAFVAQDEKGGNNVYTIEAGELHKITTTGDVIGLGLTADRKKLIWARKGPNLKYILLSLYTFDLKARSTARLPFPERVPLLNPDPRHAPVSLEYLTLAPDGRRLALLATMPAPKPGGQPFSAVYSLGLDGSGARMVRQSGPSKNAETILFPAFSRDGKHLALFAGENRKAVLAVYNADGSEGKRLLAFPQP